jgi:DNA-binding NarL/FixJ family response regulator
MKILIVDDSPVMRKTIKSIVAAPEDLTAECEDGSSVVSAYESFRPDWVLMDMKMSRTNGIEATRALKAIHPEAHVAIVTNYGDQEFRDEARAAGADQYFLKDNLPAIHRQLVQTRSSNR